MKNSQKCYALCHYNYDWYEWEHVIAVSFDKKSLEEEYEKENEGCDYKLVDEMTHKYYVEGDKEIDHYSIREIKFI